MSASRPTRSTAIAVTMFLLGALVLPVIGGQAVGANEAAVCTLVRSDGVAELTWVDQANKTVIRKNNRWLATPPADALTYIDTNASPDSEYAIRVWTAGVRTDYPCVEEPVEPPEAVCTAALVDGQVEVRWVANDATNVIRRNGKWAATIADGETTFTDPNSDPFGVYELRSISDGVKTTVPCDFEEIVEPDARRFVVHVSIDGLRPDHVTTELMPRLSEMVETGASTMNARTDPAITKTLPNHTAQFTGRFVWGEGGHNVSVNQDPGGTVHQITGSYVSSIFDVVHDYGGRTVMYVGKQKFELHQRTWGESGAPDQIGVDNGTSKIDVYKKMAPELAPPLFVEDLIAGEGRTFGFFHIRTPDSGGHTHGWATPGYEDSVRSADATLGDLIDGIVEAGIIENTTVIVTSDHGGPTGQTDHARLTLVENYTVPFVAWGADVAQGVDLYEINAGVRFDPGVERKHKKAPQPVRGHDVANLTAYLFGLPPIPGSTINYDQKLRLQ